MNGTYNGWLLFLGIIVWCLVAVVRAIRIENSSISEFELKRRAMERNEHATKQLVREQIVPRLRTLRELIDATLMVIFSALMVANFGWVLGVVVAVATSFLLGVVGRTAVLQESVQRHYDKREPKFIDMIKGWHWLDVFRSMPPRQVDKYVASKEELSEVLRRSRIFSPSEQSRVQAMLSFTTKLVGDVMTPASMIDTVKAHEVLGPLVLDDLYKTGHNRFPVVEGDLNHIVGMLYLRELLELRSPTQTARQAMDKKVCYVHEKQTLEHALHAFLTMRRHLFVVVNDYRETVGLLSLEDVVETLIGKKIMDEFDKFEDLRAVAENNPRKNNLSPQAKDI